MACDVYRPAAIDQLHVLGDQLGIEVYSNKEEKNPVKIAEAAIAHAKSAGFNTIIVDTAGRLAVDEKMMAEIEDIKKAINPQEILFVVDSMTGQDAVNTAKTFNERLDFTGVILTKLDGDTRGGAAISIKSVVNKPIKFIGTGEKMDALDVFHPSRMADRILGMGDVVSLVEKVQQQFDEEEAKKLQAKIAKNKFGFDDFLSQSLDQAPEEQIETVTDLCNTMKFGSLCALGGFTPYPVMSALTHFPEDFRPAPVREAAE